MIKKSCFLAGPKWRRLVLTQLMEAHLANFKVPLTLHPYPTIKQVPRQQGKDCK